MVPLFELAPYSKKQTVVAELKVVLKLITLGVKFQECAAHSNKSNNSK